MTVKPYVPTVLLGEWNGGEISATIECVRAENPGLMTLDGTNTWIVAAPGSGSAAIIDPGPADEAHWDNVARALDRRGLGPSDVDSIVITHHHDDHTAGIDMFNHYCEAPVYAIAPEHCRLGGEIVNLGRRRTDVMSLELGGVGAEIMPAPGHTMDSLAIVLPGEGALFSGDTILGRGTTVVAYPDGNLGQYLGSLERIRDAVLERELTRILPGHGPTVDRPLEAIDYYLDHRRSRLQQVEDCISHMDQRPEDIGDLASYVVKRVYSDVPESLWPPATLSVMAQIEYLDEH